ncbi:hypothetical protein BIY27_17845 [Gibbsiella quercinecans]|nr:hypothetical protein BIY27_17845 [Gibbsiella quercinecans]
MNAGLPATMACRHKDNSSAISNLITHRALNHAVQKKKVMYAMLREGGEQQAGPQAGRRRAVKLMAALSPTE